GDGVNVAVRLESLAEPGGICVSARVQEDAAGKLDLVFEDIGEQHLKNIVRPVRMYRVAMDRAADTPKGPGPASLPLPDKPSIAVLPFIKSHREASMRGPPISAVCGTSSSSVGTMTPSHESIFSRPLISIPPSPAATRASLWLTSRRPPYSTRAA